MLPQSLSLEWGLVGVICVGLAQICFTGPTLSFHRIHSIGYIHILSSWQKPHTDLKGRAPALVCSDCY